MPTPGPSSLAKPLPATGDLGMSCPGSQCQIHFHPPEGRTHLAVHSPKPRDGDSQRLGAELGCVGWGIHTCAPVVFMVWDGTRSGKRSRQAGQSPCTTMIQHRSLGVRILNPNLAFRITFQGSTEYVLFNSLIYNFQIRRI